MWASQSGFVEMDWVQLSVSLKILLIEASVCQYSLEIIAFIPPTARTSNGLTFRAVLGVFPRNFPGVLNISATFLQS